MAEGGSYTADKTGKARLVHRTLDHPDGNRPRDSEGAPLDTPPARPGKTKGGKVTPIRTKE